MEQDQQILKETKEYYTKKINSHGPTALGVDWNTSESQFLRFEQLLKICDFSAVFSLNDLGCGFGSLYECLIKKNFEFNYFGVDVSESMIEVALQRYGNNKNAHFSTSTYLMETADYSVASGIFNVKQNSDNHVWLQHVIQTIHMLNDKSKKGFAFNCLTKFSDKEKMSENLYYADPCYLFEYCKKNFSKNIALLHDYDLYEFTILVRKNE